MPGFHIENFGCRAARADGEAIAARLEASSCAASNPHTAEVVVVNTCSVTAEADREARAYIRRTHRRNPSARIVVTGCYAQRAPDELAALPGVAAVVGNSHKALAPQIAHNLMRGAGVESDRSLVRIEAMKSAGNVLLYSDDTFAHSFLEEAQVVPGAQTRPNLKIQEGCSNRCTFCVIPQTRGNSRSLLPENVIAQVRGFVAAGGRELVFSGINMGRWGRDLPPDPAAPRTLASLVRAIFEQTALPLLRLSSIEPMDWDDNLIALMRNYGGTRLCRHAHLPLQSGSDSVLRRMHRRYRPWHYAQKIESLLAAAASEITFGADIMAGFPGETDAEFKETLAFIRALPFGYLHLFPFSPRPGTRGWALHQQYPVPPQVVAERMSLLRSLAEEKMHAHRAQFIGRELNAITLHTPAALAQSGQTAALTENFLPVEIAGTLPSNTPVSLRVTSLTSQSTLQAIPTDPQHHSLPEPLSPQDLLVHAFPN
ncbi:MAG: MiaB/RimO family radical SAM methylthiotransferase [Acidobacteriota bacterium]|nr:MiaB/RimO family radical SAM methylthiotransferase [Acidobacteriota bacterium]